MSDFHIVVIFNDYYTLIIAFLTKQIQNRYRYRRLPDTPMLVVGPYPTSCVEYRLFMNFWETNIILQKCKEFEMSSKQRNLELAWFCISNRKCKFQSFTSKDSKYTQNRLNRIEIGLLKTSNASQMLSKVLFQSQITISNLFDQREPLTKAIIQLCTHLSFP